jgi:hypothetical protein
VDSATARGMTRMPVILREVAGSANPDCAAG